MRHLLIEEVRRSIRTAYPAVDEALLEGLSLENPRDASHGDFSSNAAFLLKGALGDHPRAIAQRIVECFEGPLGEAEVAGPGFINLRVAPGGIRAFLAELADPAKRAKMLRDEDLAHETGRIQLEFVSANPTGPMNVVSARAAAYGDACVRLYRAAGVEAASEYYVNDEGNQARLFGESLRARFLAAGGRDDAPFPEDGYRGAYVAALGESLASALAAREAAGDTPDAAAEFVRRAASGGATIEKVAPLAGEAPEGASPSREAVDALADGFDFAALGLRSMVAAAGESLGRFGVDFDRWFPESSLHAPGEGGESRVCEAERVLREREHLAERDGASWFLSTAFGDDKDRVVRRSDGTPTYLLADIAYHLDKARRGFDRVVDILGPDHHGYIRRMEAAAEALGLGKEWLRIHIVQQVNLLRDGEPVRMSKREGEFVTLDELVEEVGTDVSRFFFLMRKASSHLDFDLELAKRESMDNPVFYVQYAHARSRSIFRQPMAQDLLPEPGKTPDLSVLRAEEEVAIMRSLLRYPEIVREAARSMEPHRLVTYIRELAGTYHRFYTRGKQEPKFRVLTEDEPCSRARLFLVGVLADVLRDALGLLGIHAMDEM